MGLLERAHALIELAHAQAERVGSPHIRARIRVMDAGCVQWWRQPVGEMVELLDSAADAAARAGDTSMVHYAGLIAAAYALIAGEPLDRVSFRLQQVRGRAWIRCSTSSAPRRRSTRTSPGCGLAGARRRPARSTRPGSGC
ncbi:MAG: hypothetical protein H6704_31615 [Myxococcales bacterium]|nr:hypothetical protein [Myxococcales bacterium]